MSINPWQELHRRAERAHTYSARVADALVDAEYASAPSPVPCVAHVCETDGHRRCGLQEPTCTPVTCAGTLFWKATVGAYKCTTCGALANSQRELYR